MHYSTNLLRPPRQVTVKSRIKIICDSSGAKLSGEPMMAPAAEYTDRPYWLEQPFLILEALSICRVRNPFDIPIICGMANRTGICAVHTMFG